MTTIANNYIDSLGSKTAAAKTNNGTLGQDDFLKLMTAQLKTQDPFDPVDNTEMVAQMAEFSNVAGIAEMNSSLKSVVDSLASARMGQAAGWIGRAALVESNVATPLNDGAYAGEVTLDDDASQVSINLVDANGKVIHTETMQNVPAGTLSFVWDGKGSDGNVAATGPLQVMVAARGADGQIASSTATWTNITGVQSPASGSTKLVTPLGLLDPTEATRLS